MSSEYGAENLSEVPLGSAGGRAVVVGEVKVGDAAVECGAAKLFHAFHGVGVAKVVPQPQRDERKF